MSMSWSLRESPGMDEWLTIRPESFDRLDRIKDDASSSWLSAAQRHCCSRRARNSLGGCGVSAFDDTKAKTALRPRGALNVPVRSVRQRIRPDLDVYGARL